MAGQKRDNAYYLQRLKTVSRSLYNDVRAGRMSVNKARQIAKLGGTRTRLHELKNAWPKATPAEQLEFLAWAGLVPPSPPHAPTTSAAFDGSGVMHAWARHRVLEIMDRRNLQAGDVNDELGISRMNQSVVTAARNASRVRSPLIRTAVETWLAKNASV